MLLVLLRLLVGVLGTAICTSATCGPARADTLDRVLRDLCGRRGTEIAPLVRESSHRFLLRPTLLASLIAAESRCRKDAVGARGELSLGQILPSGSAARGYTLEQLRDPATNVEAAAKHLARCLTLCGFTAGGLSVYAGWRHCRESSYSRRVLGMLAGSRQGGQS